jgi:hypothetical protein
MCNQPSGVPAATVKQYLDEMEARLGKKFDQILGAITKQEAIMATDFSKLQAIAQQIVTNHTQLATDQTKNTADITSAIAKLGTITVAPNDQPTVDAIVTTLQGVVTQQQAIATAIEASNAQIEAALGPAPTTTAAPAV